MKRMRTGLTKHNTEIIIWKEACYLLKIQKKV